MNRGTVFLALLTAACATSTGAVVGNSLDNTVLNVSSLDVDGDGKVDLKDHDVLEGLSQIRWEQIQIVYNFYHLKSFDYKLESLKIL